MNMQVSEVPVATFGGFAWHLVSACFTRSQKAWGPSRRGEGSCCVGHER